MRLSKLAIATGAAVILTVGVAAAAQADRGVYRAFSVTEAATAGLPVKPPLGNEFVAVSRARVIVPGEWQRLKSKADRLEFLSSGGTCRYRVTFTVRSRVAGARPASEYAADALPGPGSQYLLDSGQRGSSAFRVIREKGTGPRVRVRGLRAAVLTRRSDVAPSGQTVWSELLASAVSRTGDECHSGTWRQRLGPQIGDALATARTNLAFVRKAR